MCVICVSKSGTAQPTEAVMRQMFNRNPHGAGYMVAREGRVEISKGFMTWDEFLHAIRYEKFTAQDAVVYHFRISTQAGVGPEMTHPFPLTRDIRNCKLLDAACPIGVAHNGVIRLTSDSRDREYSDTAHYVAEILCHLVRSSDDLRDPAILAAIERTTSSKWALMDDTGYIATVGNFITDKSGILYSNDSFRGRSGGYPRNSVVIRNFFDDDPCCF